ncbi:Thiol-disulfide interchange protein, contains DsbC and DsbD domains [Pelagibacterium luteolum]|uniref:Thiol-disulfide interchange protein, contains DsbC and DsbD domains n=1 Tax=Pelagibacterium luteolum TaxID=440168 RepID=A0A1G7TXZ6_9HYPH|nr:Thiol-disulfide interchange protein, contains DsbC and DsbD domains [Pelagibacterium luteolum]
MRTPLVLSLIIVFACSPALGSESAWVELTPGVDLRLVSSDVVTEDGTVWMGLEFNMPEDTKTYWRVPGESGIPLELDATASTGIGSIDVAWPYPKREIYDGYLDHSYYGPTLIPLEVSLGADRPHIDLDIMVGICSDICVPAMARLELAPSLDAADAPNQLRIRQALADVPLPDDSEDIFGAALFDANRNAVLLARHASEFDVDTMIAELVGTTMVFDAPRLSSDGGAIVFPVLGRVKPEMFSEGTMRFSFDTQEGSFETLRPVTTEH